MPKMMPEIFSSPVITRYQEGRPILTKENVPYPAELIFNAGVTKYQGKYVMVFRDDYDCHNGFPKKNTLGARFQHRWPALGSSGSSHVECRNAPNP